MKVFDSKIKNAAYFFYRIVSPVFDPVYFVTGLYGYIWFLRDMVTFTLKAPKVKLLSINLFPLLHDKTSVTPFDAHYFHQQLWAFDHIVRRKPAMHVDIGSTYEMSGYISKITKAKFVDLRPINTNLKNLIVEKGDITKLPYENNTITSLSCLHVVEHIGLGRYGDTIDPDGTKKACKELARVLARNGILYFSAPIGKSRICFNAHRIHTPDDILKYFNGLKLVSFSVVDDSGKFYENVDYKNYRNLNYGCGMFLFKK